MAGRYNPANPSKRPGNYVNFRAKTQQRVNAPLQGVAATIITHDWGPINETVEVNSMGDFKAVFGDSTDTQGYRDVYQLFKGEGGITGRGGAATVLVRRSGTNSAAKAKKNLTNGTDANALVLEAVYAGTKGDDLAVGIEADAVDSSTHHNIVIFFGGAEVERFKYAKTDINAAAVAVNAGSGYVRATANVSGTALTTISTGSPAGFTTTAGNDGAPLDAGAYTAAMADLGTRRFGVFTVSLDQTANGSIATSIKTWAADPNTGLNARGKNFVTVMGGGSIGSPDTLSAAMTRADAFASGALGECFVTPGAFRVRDLEIPDPATGDPLELTPATFSPRIAGIICARGYTGAINFARLADVEIIASLSTDADFVLAGDQGVTTLSQDSNAIPARIELGVTCYQSNTVAKPKELFSNIKFVRVMHIFETRLNDYAESGDVIGRLGVTQETREELIGKAKKFLSDLEVEGAINVGQSDAFISTDPPPQSTDNFVSIDYEMEFTRDLAQLRNNVVVS